MLLEMHLALIYLVYTLVNFVISIDLKAAVSNICSPHFVKINSFCLSLQKACFDCAFVLSVYLTGTRTQLRSVQPLKSLKRIIPKPNQSKSTKR